MLSVSNAWYLTEWATAISMWRKIALFTVNRQTWISASDASLILNFTTVSAHLKKNRISAFRKGVILPNDLWLAPQIHDKNKKKKYSLKNRDTNRWNNISLNVELAKGDCIVNKCHFFKGGVPSVAQQDVSSYSV